MTEAPEPFASDLINAQGVPRYGVMDQPVGQINYLDYDLRNAMDKPLNQLRKHLGFNQFQFVGLTGPDFIGGIAIVNLKLVGNAFAYVYDFNTRRLEEFSFLIPGAFGVGIPTTPDEGESYFRRGRSRFSIDAHGAVRSRDVRVQLPGRLEVFSQMRETPGFKPLRVCARAGYNGWVYTQKAAGLVVSGHISSPRRRFELDARCRASYDWSCGFMRRETAWNWSSLSLCLPDGRSLGLNLAAGVNETGVTENALWLDSQLSRLDLAQFEFNRYQPDTPWRIRTADGRVDLEFEPLGARSEKMNALLLATNFRQFFGFYRGVVVGPDGERIELDQVPGVVEDHYAKW